MKFITDIYVRKLANETVEGISTDYSFAEKKYIMEYFGRFKPSLFTSAPVIDAFTGKQVADANNCYFDGEYTWYEAEIYYFEHYGLKLRNDFIDHALAFKAKENFSSKEC